MKYYILIPFLLLCLPASAQLSLDRQVVANAGTTLSSASLSQEFTLAEALIQVRSSSSITLTEGFQQGNPPPPTSIGPLVNAGMLTLYPQPAGDYLFFQLSEPYSTTLYLDVYDLTGRQLIRRKELLPPGAIETQVDISGQAPGTYLLRLSDETGNHVLQRKWMKN